MQSALIIVIFSIITLYITSVEGLTTCISDCKNKIVSDDKVTCASHKACESSELSASINILCSEDYACSKAKSLTAKYEIECAGDYSCERVNVIKATDGNVECNGGYSCQKANVIAGNNIYCRQSGSEASRSCQSATLNAGNNIILSSMSGAQKAIVNAGADIVVTIKNGGLRAKLNAGRSIWVTAADGAPAAKFTVADKLVCRGERSCWSSRKISSTTGILSVELDGANAGMKSNIFCPTTGKCAIKCSNNGCVSSTKVYYTKTTDLYIFPSQCGPTSADRPDSCPTLQKKKASEVDELLLAADAADFPDDAEIFIDDEMFVKDDFMAFIGMDVEQGINTEYPLNSYIVNGLVAVVIIMMVIGACVYYRGRSKYEVVEFE